MDVLRRGWLVPGVALFAAGIVGQEFVLRDAIRGQINMYAADIERLRLVTVGRHGETRELVGNQWLLRPGTGPRLSGGLTYRVSARRTLAFGTGPDNLAQTWEYDGVTWQQRTPAMQPSARNRFAMTYDWVRDRVVLFGGFRSLSNLADTWEWDGSNWAQQLGPGPSARWDSTATFDVGRGVTVLFGGSTVSSVLNDTWEWNGASWQLRTLPAAPPPRSFPALAYDLARSVCVLFGAMIGDLWEYDGVTWRQVPFTNGPGPRHIPNMVFDFERGETVLLGGFDAVTNDSDSYSWNGSRWQLVAAEPDVPPFSSLLAAADPVGGGAVAIGDTLSAQTWRYAGGSWTPLPFTFPAPGPRTSPAMWSDGQHAWMFSGENLQFGFVPSDTWQWNGTFWQALPMGVRPSPRGGAAVAFDAARGRAVLFGGGNVFGDTWTFDGTTWQQETPATVPPPRRSHALAFDPMRARVVMFGGEVTQLVPRNDTWEWDGANWAATAPPQRPPAFGNPAMAFDARLQRVVMTHSPPTGSSSVLEAWTWDGANWTPLPLRSTTVLPNLNGRHSLVALPGSPSLFVVEGSSVQELVLSAAATATVGVACDPGAPRLAARTRPGLGAADAGIDVVGAPPRSFVALGAAVAAAPSPLGGCTLQLTPPIEIVLLSTNALGFASHRIAVPSLPSLVGAVLHFQAAALQPALPMGITLSAALQLVVGG